MLKQNTSGAFPQSEFRKVEEPDVEPKSNHKRSPRNPAKYPMAIPWSVSSASQSPTRQEFCGEDQCHEEKGKDPPQCWWDGFNTEWIQRYGQRDQGDHCEEKCEGCPTKCGSYPFAIERCEQASFASHVDGKEKNKDTHCITCLTGDR